MKTVTRAGRSADLAQRLAAHGLRPTRQRLGLATLLFERPHHHVTAEELFSAAKRRGQSVSLATVYNNLNQFTAAGLLREVVVEAGRSYFDTNVDAHHHFFDTRSGRLTDIPATGVSVAGLPKPPKGATIESVDVIVRLARRG